MNLNREVPRFLLGLAVVALFFFALLLLEKAIFGAFIWSELKGLPRQLIVDAVVRGLPFEAASLIMVFIPALSLFYLAALIRRPWPEMILLTYLVVTSVIFLLIGLADLQYFEESGKHLSYEATRYLNASGLPLLLGAFSLHPWLSSGSILLLGSVAAATCWLFSRLIRFALPPVISRPSLLILSTSLPLLAAGYFAANRGFGGTIPHLSAASISANPYLNALCLNPVFAVFDSLLLARHQETGFYDRSFNTRRVQQLVGPEERFENPDYPLLRTSAGLPRGNRKNVVIFILESWSGKDVGILGGPPGITPFFDDLARQGAFFDHFYATGIRSAEGIFSILCSFPNQPVKPILDRPNAFTVQWRALSEITREAGYTNIFMHGRDLNFDHIKTFLRSIGFERIVDRDAFPASAPRAGGAWPGYDDEEVMRRAHAEFVAQEGRPFLGVIYTMNTHPPFMTPDGFPRYTRQAGTQTRFLNSLHYADHTLKIFFELARAAPYFQDTVFVLVADHARTRDTFNLDSQHRIPFLIYAPGMVAPALRSVVGSQLDILPTILGLLQLKTLHASWGQNLLAIPATGGFALSIAGNDLRWHEASYLLHSGSASGQPLLFDLERDSDCRKDIWIEQRKVGDPIRTNLLAYLTFSQTLLFEDRIFPRSIDRRMGHAPGR